MANKKFSEFTSQTDSANVQFVVGYNGSDNVRISPGNLLGAYLPLAGGTMTGNTIHGDNVKSIYGSPGNDLQIYHDASNSYINDAGTGLLKLLTNGLEIKNAADDSYMAFFGSTGASELYHNGSKKFETTSTGVSVTGDATFPDDGKALFGASYDLQVYHDGSNSYVRDTGTGILYIDSNGTGVNIISDGSSATPMANFVKDGAVELYHNNLKKIETTATGVSVTGNANFADDGKAIFGAGGDLEIYHSGSASYIKDVGTGHLVVNATDFVVNNSADTKNMIIATDGGGVDLYHNASKKLETTASGVEVSGTVDITQSSASDPVLRLTDDGVANYDFIFPDSSTIKLETSTASDKTFKLINAGAGVMNLELADNGKAIFGAGGDFEIYHDGSNSYIDSIGTGDLYIRCGTDNESIIFQNDDGAGGLETYFELQGVAGGASPFTVFPDSSNLVFGAGHDLRVYHNGSGSYADNYTGVLQFTNYADDSDIIFRSDDSTGGVTEYFKVDGTNHRVKFSKDSTYSDNVKALFGDSLDLEIYHTGSHSFISEQGTGSLITLATDYQLNNSANSQNMITASDGGAVTLFTAGVAKLATTSTGVSVTGQVNISALNTAVTNASDTGTLGEIRFTADYIFVCVATDTWKRVAIATW